MSIFSQDFFPSLWFWSLPLHLQVGISKVHPQSNKMFSSLLTPYVLYPLKAISMTCSIFMMMSLAIERYIAVSKPLSRVPSSHSAKFILRYLIPVIFCSFLLNLPKFFLFRVSFMNSSDVFISITELRTNHYYITYYSWTR